MTGEAVRHVRLRERFIDLHRGGTFLMPNAWDIGSAKILATLGFPAIATTSSGFGASLTFAAYGALTAAARELLASGTSTYSEGVLSNNDRRAAFGEGAVET